MANGDGWLAAGMACSWPGGGGGVGGWCCVQDGFPHLIDGDASTECVPAIGR
jgi:hypothetical protein